MSRDVLARSRQRRRRVRLQRASAGDGAPRPGLRDAGDAQSGDHLLRRGRLRFGRSRRGQGRLRRSDAGGRRHCRSVRRRSTARRATRRSTSATAWSDSISRSPSSARCITARAPARDSRSKCRCSKPWRSSCSPITWAAARSSPPVGPMGYKRLLSRTRGPYPTRDGYLAIVVYTDKHWRAFLTTRRQVRTCSTPIRAFATRRSRTQHAEDMGRFLAEHLPHEDDAGMARRHCAKSTFPRRPSTGSTTCSMIRILTRSISSATSSTRPRGRSRSRAFPIEFSKTPASVRRLAPNLVEHTDEVLGSARCNKWPAAMAHAATRT